MYLFLIQVTAIQICVYRSYLNVGELEVDIFSTFRPEPAIYIFTPIIGAILMFWIKKLNSMSS